jgi:broad specificity phosphatase PhoE
LIRVYIARHGETTWNVEGRIQGRSDPELSPKGDAQSLALVEQLKDKPLTAIYTSTLKRSILTAQPIACHLGLPIERRSELDEIAFGILEGRLFSLDAEARKEWERFREDRFSYRIPGGENYTDVANRVRPFMEKILRTHGRQEILLVGHRVVNRVLIGMLLGYSLEKVPDMEQLNGFLYLIERNTQNRIFHFVNGEVREGFVMVERPLTQSSLLKGEEEGGVVKETAQVDEHPKMER